MHEQPPTLGQINLVVASIADSIKFYRLLGLTIDDSHPMSNQHITVRLPNGFMLDFDSTDFAKRWDIGWCGIQGTGRNVIGFNFASREAVDGMYGKLTGAGYRSQQPPFDAFWGARYAVVEDHDGNPVGLMSPMETRSEGAQ